MYTYVYIYIIYIYMCMYICNICMYMCIYIYIYIYMNPGVKPQTMHLGYLETPLHSGGDQEHPGGTQGHPVGIQENRDILDSECVISYAHVRRSDGSDHFAYAGHSSTGPGILKSPTPNDSTTLQLYSSNTGTCTFTHQNNYRAATRLYSTNQT